MEVLHVVARSRKTPRYDGTTSADPAAALTVILARRNSHHRPGVAYPTILDRHAQNVIPTFRVSDGTTTPGEQVKYEMAVSKLGKDKLNQVSDLISNPPKQGRYNALKNRLLRAFQASADAQFNNHVWVCTSHQDFQYL
ncbi:unnamed protein product [Parnassius apollo]|uniref:(apollo) hypothetical protein n=1 Tax=Parnassius apollo TaxID=110799 RepID=A0A8S3WMV6_PARAO|nr:unnamed protein product [Parnassius apollo]